jgi:hypothetical protein
VGQSELGGGLYVQFELMREGEGQFTVQGAQGYSEHINLGYLGVS